jgi:hypothetical protein
MLNIFVTYTENTYRYHCIKPLAQIVLIFLDCWLTVRYFFCTSYTLFLKRNVFECDVLKVVILGWRHSIITFNDATVRLSHKVILNGTVLFQLSLKLRSMIIVNFGVC